MKAKSVRRTRKILPKSKGECARILIQTAPPLDHEYGYYPETALKWVALFDISPKEFWEEMHGNTCCLEETTNKTIIYPCDVERIIRGHCNKRWVSLADWD